MVKKLSINFIVLCILLSFGMAIFSYSKDIDLGEKSMPVIYLEVKNFKALNRKSDYTPGTMEIVHDKYGTEVLPMQIKVRGNSTAGQPKKPYHIKLDSSSELFDMGKNKHWLLLADALDRTHLRNKLAFDLAYNLGMDYVKSTYAEVYLNGNYLGLYMFCEQIRVSSSRVDIYDWEGFAENIAKLIGKTEGKTDEEIETLITGMQSNLAWITTGTYKSYTISDYYDLSDIDITGGYLIENDDYFDEISKFRTTNEVLMMIQEPEYLNTNAKMFEYIQTYIQDLEDAIYSTTRYNRDGMHFTEYIDLESFIDFWIVFEAFKNVEISYKSCYMYKDIGGKIVFGPVWDFDWSSGNHVVLHSDSRVYDKWNNSESQNRAYWYKQLYSDPFFMTRLKERWDNSLDLIYGMILSIDTHVEYLAPHVEKNIKTWGDSGYTYEREIDELSTWLINRVEWMNTQLANDNPNIMGRGWVTDDAIEIGQSQDGDIITFTISCTEDTNKLGIFLNGILQPSIDLIDGSGTFTVDVSKPLPNQLSNDNTYKYKNNVLTIYKYNDDTLKPSAMNYTVFQLGPDEEETIPAAEIISTTGTTSNYDTVIKIGIITVAVVVFLIAFGLSRKKLTMKN